MNNTIIKLLPEHLETIRTHAESTYPDECCGVILGYQASECKTVVEIIPTVNAWSTQAANLTDENTADDEKRRYAIAPEDMIQIQRKARDFSLNIIGIYHSHPDHEAVPSECDRLYAWQEYSYIIVSVQNGKAAELKSWNLDNNHQFQPETIKYIT